MRKVVRQRRFETQLANRYRCSRICLVILSCSFSISQSEAIHVACRFLQTPQHAEIFSRAATFASSSSSSSSPQSRVLSALSVVSYFILRRDRDSSATLHSDLVSRLAYAPNFLRALWDHALCLDTVVIGDKRCSLIALIVRGVDISIANLHRLAPSLTLFCACFVHLLFAIHDNEFLVRPDGTTGDGSASGSGSDGRKRQRQDYFSSVGAAGAEEEVASWNPMPFVEAELVALCAMMRDLGVGIIRLAHPDSWTQVSRKG